MFSFRRGFPRLIRNRFFGGAAAAAGSLTARRAFRFGRQVASRRRGPIRRLRSLAGAPRRGGLSRSMIVKPFSVVAELLPATTGAFSGSIRFNIAVNVPQWGLTHHDAASAITQSTPANWGDFQAFDMYRVRSVRVELCMTAYSGGAGTQNGVWHSIVDLDRTIATATINSLTPAEMMEYTGYRAHCVSPSTKTQIRRSFRGWVNPSASAAPGYYNNNAAPVTDIGARHGVALFALYGSSGAGGVVDAGIRYYIRVTWMTELALGTH